MVYGSKKNFLLSYPTLITKSLSRMEYRPLEGFILAITPFNFTAIGGNLPGTPALVGNTVIWKPSPMAIYSNYLVYQILTEAGLPPGVIQFVPGPAEQIAKRCIRDREFGGLHFTGSTLVFKSLWKDIVANLDVYRTFPRIVGETGGKNFHVVHQSADVGNAVMQSVRAAFEYQGIFLLLPVVLLTRPQVRNVRRFRGYTFPPLFGKVDSRNSSSPKFPRLKSEVRWIGKTLLGLSCTLHYLLLPPLSLTFFPARNMLTTESSDTSKKRKTRVQKSLSVGRATIQRGTMSNPL